MFDSSNCYKNIEDLCTLDYIQALCTCNIKVQCIVVENRLEKRETLSWKTSRIQLGFELGSVRTFCLN